MEKSPERSGAPCGAEPREEGTEEQNGKQSGKSLFFEIVRFLIVGGTATLVDYAVSYLLYRWLLPPEAIGGTPSLVLSTAAGFCVGLAVNWTLSVLFVFRNVKDKKKSRSGGSFLKFALIGAVGLAVGLCIQGIVSGWMDVCSIYACPIGALLAGVFFYWVWGKEDCLAQVNLARRRPLGRWFYPTAKYVYCGVTVLVLILGAVNGGIG